MPMTRATIGKVDEKSDHIMSPKIKMNAVGYNKTLIDLFMYNLFVHIIVF